jgi:hypothetical protein
MPWGWALPGTPAADRRIGPFGSLRVPSAATHRLCSWLPWANEPVGLVD